jgi:NAD(P)-dependent dehydrogenase (short-subunit alcohol dehydrogenase family)
MLAMTKLTVITGAAGALGQAVVEEFAGRRDTVVAMDQPGPRLDALGQVDGVHPVPVDLTSVAEVDTAWQRVDTLALGPPATLVCIAGAFAGGGLADTDPATLDAMLGVNLATALWSCRAAAPRMRAAGGGSIVTVGSRAGVTGSAPVAYAAAKAALIRASEVLADELRPDRIRVNCVLPSVIDTPANRSWMSADAVAHAVQPAAIAKVVAFLCSDGAAPISGAAIPVYGDA